MVSIRGPKSALSDFIEEHNIKINKKSDNVSPKVNKTSLIKKTKKNKKIKKCKPFELSSANAHTKSLQNKILSYIARNINKYKLEDRHLEMLASFLSIRRMLDTSYFNFISSSVKQNLVIYDCSMIKNDEFNVFNNQLIRLELHQCGQLTNEKLNCILEKQENLKELRITGAYLLTNICLPSNLSVLDLSNCNRLTNQIIIEINSKYKNLEELRLSYCYRITAENKLKTNVSKLYLDETHVSESFFCRKNITGLSIKNCCLINNLNRTYSKIKLLDLQNIITIKSLKIGNELQSLNIKRCYNLMDWIINNFERLKNLEYFNLSYLNFECYDFIFKLTNLKEVDLSWCANITDNLLIKIIEQTKIQKLYVFGCFNLTCKSAKISYKYKNQIEVIGNHAETKYLIENG